MAIALASLRLDYCNSVLFGTSQSNLNKLQRIQNAVARMVMMAVWLSGNALASINVVALRQTRLVLGWVTVRGRVNHFGM